MNEKFVVSYGKYIDLRIILTTALVVILGVSQRQALLRTVVYMGQFLKAQLN